MDRFSISKEDLLSQISRAYCVDNKPIACSFDMLKLTFGFNRVSGIAFMFNQVFFKKTEEEMSLLPRDQIMKNIDDWCIEMGILYSYDSLTDSYLFGGFKVPLST